MDPEFSRLDQLLHHGDPEAAWPQVLEYVSREATTHAAEVTMLVEDLIYLHADRFIDRMEAEVATNHQFRLAVSGAYIGGVVGAGIDRFLALQQAISG
jgi:hypothetical protein